VVFVKLLYRGRAGVSDTAAGGFDQVTLWFL
jgi:hypothetical protein